MRACVCVCVCVCVSMIIIMPPPFLWEKTDHWLMKWRLPLRQQQHRSPSSKPSKARGGHHHAHTGVGLPVWRDSWWLGFWKLMLRLKKKMGEEALVARRWWHDEGGTRRKGTCRNMMLVGGCGYIRWVCVSVCVCVCVCVCINEGHASFQR